MTDSSSRLQQLEQENARLVRENRAAYDQLARLREALQWYTQDALYDEIEWDNNDLRQTIIDAGLTYPAADERAPLLDDAGERARVALDDSVNAREDVETQTPERLFVWLEAGESVGVCAVSRRCAWESSAATSLDGIAEYRPVNDDSSLEEDYPSIFS